MSITCQIKSNHAWARSATHTHTYASICANTVELEINAHTSNISIEREPTTNPLYTSTERAYSTHRTRYAAERKAKCEMWGGEGWKSATDCNMIWLQRRKLKRGISINNNEENPSEREIERRPQTGAEKKNAAKTNYYINNSFDKFLFLLRSRVMDFCLAACVVGCGLWARRE